MSNITFGGLASGLDTNSIIDAYVKAERVPIDALTTQKTNIDAAATTITGISSKLTTLRTAAAALADPNQFAAMTATSTDTSVVATAAAGAVGGSYDINVTQLAKEQRTYSDTQTSGTDALNLSGSLSLQVGSGTAAVVSVDATDSLSAIASKINASGARVSANVLYDGTSYRLSIRGLDTGAANAVTFGENGFSLGLNTAANTKQAAQDAKLTVDGVAVTRSTNQVVGVITGVTLGLTKVTAANTPTTVTVATDATALTTKINTFVSAYNQVMFAGQQAAGYGTTAATNAVLAADPTIRSVMSRLSQQIGTTVAGTTGKYTTLMSVGFASTKDGLLTFDSTKLTTALSADSTSVAKLFTKDANLSSTGAFSAINSVIDSLNTSTSSPILARIASLQKQSSRITETTDSMERRITTYTDALKQQFSDLETIVSKYKTMGSSLTASTAASTSSG